MKAFILAGGEGSRLLPYTTNFPKPLMPIKDKPILEIVIDRLRKADIKEIILGTGHLAELLQAEMLEKSPLHVSLRHYLE